MWKMSCPSSIQCRDSNPRPLERESPPINKSFMTSTLVWRPLSEHESNHKTLQWARDYQGTLTIRVIINVWLVPKNTVFGSGTLLHANNNTFSWVAESKPVWPETSCTAILPPEVSVLWPFADRLLNGFQVFNSIVYHISTKIGGTTLWCIKNW